MGNLAVAQMRGGTMVAPCGTAVWRALCRGFYERKVVRDLLWAVSSPHLIDDQLFPVLPVHFGLTGDEADAVTLVEWLEALERDASHLIAFLHDKTKDKTKALALGVYFASLLEYWLRFCPLLRVTKFELSKQIVSATNLTLGQLKFLFRVLHDADNDDSFDDFHVESSVKFFLLHPLDEQFRPQKAVDQGEIQSTYPLEQFVGPHLGENLAWRVQEVARKLDMCRGSSVQTWLRRHYSDNVLSRIVLRGYLFYPLRHFESTSDVARGHDWRLHRHPEATESDVTNRVRHNPKVGADHLRGWWASDLEREFADRVRANAATGVGESRFIVLPKLHWLSSVIAEERVDESGKICVVVQGEDDLQIETVEAVTLEDVVQFARGHFAALAASEDAQNNGGVVMPLLVAEIVRCRPHDVEYTESKTLWKELSRGFLLDPKCWDPLPLCRDAVRFKRTTHDEHVNEREYEGRREWVKDGVIKPTDQEAELARLKKLHAFVDPGHMTPSRMCDELVAIVEREQKTFTHNNLKQSVQTVFSEACTGGEAGEFVLDCMKYLVLSQFADHSVDDDSKIVQRVAHLLLDAFEGHPDISGQVDAFVEFFLAVAQEEALWNYINVSLRAVDILQQRTSSTGNQHGRGTFDSVHRLLEKRVPRWNTVAVEIVRVFNANSTAADAITLHREMLEAFMAQCDWKSAEQLVTSCSPNDTELAISLFKRFNALNMTKPMKRLRKICARIQAHVNVSSLADPRDGLEHALGPLLDASANKQRVIDGIPSLQWTLADTPAGIDAIVAHLRGLIERSTNTPVIIGLDCEWRPQFLVKETENRELPVGEDEGVSVYQIAVEDRAYVVDVQVLGGTAEQPLKLIWEAPIGTFILVGFCVSGDLRRLNHSFPSLLVHRQAARQRVLVELKQLALYRQLPASHWGLSQLYETCFGESIDKEKQCSDWASRPLSQEQLQYAARDAYAVRNIALHLVADYDASRQDLVSYFGRFAVVTQLGQNHPEEELGHWITMLHPLNQSHVRTALIQLGLHNEAQSIFTIDKASWDGDARMSEGLLVKTIAIVLRNGGTAPSGSSIHYAAAVLHVDKSIDMAALAAHFGVQVEDLVLADRETLIRVFGYQRGSVGPIGLREQAAIHIVLDAALFGEAAILPGAGQEDDVYSIQAQTLRNAVHASSVGLSH